MPEGIEWCHRHPDALADGGYRLSKEAIILYTMRKAAALGANGIRINCTGPGVTETPILDQLRDRLRPALPRRHPQAIGPGRRSGRAGRGAGVPEQPSGRLHLRAGALGRRRQHRRRGRARTRGRASAVASLTDFRRVADDVRNWGRWGDDDELGHAELHHRGQGRPSGRLVKHGKVFPLGVDFGSSGPQGAFKFRHNPIHVMTVDGGDANTLAQYGPEWLRNPGGAGTERVLRRTICFASTTT